MGCIHTHAPPQLRAHGMHKTCMHSCHELFLRSTTAATAASEEGVEDVERIMHAAACSAVPQSILTVLVIHLALLGIH